MALSGSSYTQVGQHWRVVLEWSASQSISNNQSTITARLYWQSIDGYGTVSSSDTKSGNIVINGTTYPFSGAGLARLSGAQKKLLHAATRTITHNADGTKSIGISGTFGMAVTLSGTHYGSRSVTLTANLNTIPRATKPSLPSTVTMGDTVTINLPRASGNFTHNLSHDFKVGSWTNIATGVGTSYLWTVPKTFANRLPNVVSGMGRIRADTLNGSSTIGSAQSTNFVASIPDTAEFRPSISSVAISESVSGLAAHFGGYVQGKSRLRVQTTAAGAYSSTITTYKTTVANATYTSNPATTAVLPNSGTVPVAVTVTDSRGRTVSQTSNVTVIPYAAPSIKSFSVVRANSAGAEDPSHGTYAKARIKFSVAPVNNKNTKSWSLQYKLQSASTWTNLTAGAVYTYDGTYVSASGVLNVDNAYDLRLTVSDYFSSASQVVKVGSAFTIMDFGASGRGIAFGKVYQGTATNELGGTTRIDEIASTRIPAGSDLNDYTKPGFYYCPGDDDSLKIADTPTAGAFSLLVERHAGTKQTFTRYLKDYLRTYIRNYYNDWGPWHELAIQNQDPSFSAVTTGAVNYGTKGALINTDAPGQTLRLRNGYTGKDEVCINLTGGQVVFYMDGGVARHAFRADGTKLGGSIVIDGEVLGMSPIDSPRVLLQDIILGVQATPEGTPVTLDAKLMQVLDGYGVWPSQPVEIRDKTQAGFMVVGEGVVDLQIIGARKGYGDTYWQAMPEALPEPEPEPDPEPEPEPDPEEET